MKLVVIIFILVSLVNLSYSYVAKAVRVVRPYKKPITAIVISPDKKKLAVGYINGRVSVVDLISYKVRVLGRHFGEVNDISWSYDSRYVVSCSSDMTVRLWDIQTKKVRIMSEHGGIVFAVAAHPNRMLIASGASDNRVILWEPNTNKIRTMGIHNSSIWSLSFSLDGKFLAIGGGEGNNKVILWKYSSGQTVRIKAHNRGINFLGFSSSGKLLVSASVDKYIKIWDIKKKKLVVKYKFKRPIWKAIFDPSSSFVIFSTRDRYIHKVNFKTLKRVTIYRHNTMVRAITVNKSYIVLADNRGRILFLANKVYLPDLR